MNVNAVINFAAVAGLLVFVLYGVKAFYAHFRLVEFSVELNDLERQLLQQRMKHLLDRKEAERKETELSWRGLRKFQVKKKVLEQGNIASFYLAPHDGKPLPPYKPGQYLTFQLNIPGQPKPVIRCYSLSDSPNHPDYYRVSIKKVPAPFNRPDLPAGLSSNYFHELVKEGDILDCKAPGGHFFLDLTKQRPVVLVGGGVGITPVLSMLNAITEQGARRETWFFLGVRHSQEHCFREHLNRIAFENPNVKLQVCYSEPLPSKDRRGKDYHHAERVSVDLFKRVLPSNNYDFYVCGPGLMMETLKTDCHAWGVPPENFHMEAFGAATVKQVAAALPAAAAAGALEVVFKKSGKKVAWTPGTASLLDLAEANGVNMDFGCRAGNCGTCAVAINSGEVQYTVDTGAKPEGGSCLACVSVPKTNLTVDA